MKINHLIQKTYETTHSYASINSIEQRLLDNSFLVVMDEGGFTGILTSSDVIESPYQLVIDCLHQMPRVNFDQDIRSVLGLMAESRSFVLPVFKEEEFVGVITEKTITDYLLEYRKEIEEAISKRTAELKAANEQLKQEIEERKKVQEALRESEEWLCRLIETAEEGIWIIDAGNNTTFVNPKMAEMLGYTVNEMAGKSLFAFMDEEGRLSAQGLVERRRQFVREQHEFRFRRKDGTDLWTIVTTNPVVDKKGLYSGAMAMITDITERKRTEEELLKVQKMESLGILAGGIAHDFNNLLTGIVGAIALSKLNPKLDPEVFQSLNHAEKAAFRAKRLTGQLLTFSRGGTPVKKTVSITGLVQDTASFALLGSNARCEFSIPDDLWLVEVDEGQISQVINNLVINARHAMSESGTVGVRAKNLIVGAEHGLPLKDGRYVQIAIEDHGTGIPEEHLPKIFDPYFSTKEKGRGLGLAVSYSIIQKHDGYIDVKSGLGAGTTFYVYLLASEKQMVEGREKEAEELPRGEGRILVMDDEDIVRSTARQMLGHMGYEVELARDGAEAIKIYKEARESGKPFAAVILDLTVPGGMGGKEAIKKLMEIDPGVKGIVSSGYSDDPVMAEFEKHGFRGVIPKPYSIEELGKTLHDLIHASSAKGI